MDLEFLIIISFGDLEKILAIVGGIITIPNNIKPPINLKQIPTIRLIKANNKASMSLTLIPFEIAKS